MPNGTGYVVVFLLIGVILCLDKLVMLVAFLVEKWENRKKRKQ
jgi:hypothetical protein